MTAVTPCPGGLEIRIRLTPNGGADRIDGVAVDADGRPYIKARVRTLPEKGAANKALIALIAKTLRIPKSSVTLVRGATARIKTIQASGIVDLREAQSKLGETSR